MLSKLVLHLALLGSASAQTCPTISGGSINTLGGDGQTVLKDLPVPFSVTFEADVDPASFSVSVTGDAKGNKLELGSSGVEGILRFKKADRNSAEADAPDGNGCSPKFVCYAKATVVVTDLTGACPDAEYSFLPAVHGKNAPLWPLLLSVIVGPLTGDPIITLAFAGWVARCMLVGDGWLGTLRYLDTDLVTTLSGSFAAIFLFAVMMSGVTGAAIKSGGVDAIGTFVSKFVKNSFLGQLATYIAGFVFFIDDYSNTLIVGNTLRVITDRMRVSREKLSWIVDCTASPIAGLMPLSTWIGYEVSLIKDELAAIGYTKEGAYTIFILSIPKRFYSWYMLVFVLAVILMGRDFGPMYYAEVRARDTGMLSKDDEPADEESKEDEPQIVEATISGSKDGKDLESLNEVAQAVDTDRSPASGSALLPKALWPNPAAPKRVYNAAIPFGLFLVLFFPLLFYSGAKQASWGGVGWNVGSRTIVGNADSWQTLYWVTGFIMAAQILLYAFQYDKAWGGCLLTPQETLKAFIAGTGLMYGGMVALLIAFVFAANLKALLIADYLVDGLGDNLNETTLPSTIFCLCAVYSFATGTSWGTMAVFFQPAFALAVYIFQDNGDKPDKDIDTNNFTEFLTKVTAAILGGAVWGDHCSFVSDTTILSAAASFCPLWDHYVTQLPYAALAGILAILFGFLPCAAGAPDVLCILISIPICSAFIYGISSIPGVGGLVGNYDPVAGTSIGSGFRSNLKSAL